MNLNEQKKIAALKASLKISLKNYKKLSLD